MVSLPDLFQGDKQSRRGGEASIFSRPRTQVDKLEGRKANRVPLWEQQGGITSIPAKLGAGHSHQRDAQTSTAEEHRSLHHILLWIATAIAAAYHPASSILPEYLTTTTHLESTNSPFHITVVPLRRACVDSLMQLVLHCEPN